MHRRHILKTSLAAFAAAAATRPDTSLARSTQVAPPAVEGATIYLHPASGADSNPGTKTSPIRTLAEAARRVNQSSGSGPLTVMLSEGVYAVGETTLLKPERRVFSKAGRLTIRAEVLPDDPDWHIGRMPTLIHTLPVPPTWNGRPDPLGGAADGMLVETSHVMIQGLRVLGMPVIESPRPGLLRRLYAISRLRRDLEDLEIAQCLFAGEEVTNPNHVAVIAHGQGVVVRNCVFRGLKISVVYWTGGSGGHAMRHCLVHGVYGSGVWTSGIADDFDYRNNVVDSCNYVWTNQSAASAQADAAGRGARSAGATPTPPAAANRYRVIDSLFANNRRLAGTGTGARLEYADLDPSFLSMTGTTITEQAVQFERDSTRRDYLHPVAGSDAAKVGAGLFTTPR